MKHTDQNHIAPNVASGRRLVSWALVCVGFVLCVFGCVGDRAPARDLRETDSAHIRAALERGLSDYSRSPRVSAYSGSTLAASDYTVPDSLLPLIRLGDKALPALRAIAADERGSERWVAVVCLAIIEGKEVSTGRVMTDPQSGVRFTQFVVRSSGSPARQGCTGRAVEQPP